MKGVNCLVGLLLLVLPMMADEALVGRVKGLFALERLHSKELIAPSLEFQSLLHDVQVAGLSNEARDATRRIIDAMTSFRFVISTNRVDDGMAKAVIVDRGEMFCEVVRNLPLLHEDTNLLARVVAYAGALEEVDFRHNLLRAHFSFGFDDPKDALRFQENLRRLEPERELQERVGDANSVLRDVRWKLLSCCGEALVDFRKKLSTADFAIFTNRLERSKELPFLSRKALFRRVAPLDEFIQAVYVGRVGLRCRRVSRGGNAANPPIVEEVEAGWNAVLGKIPEEEGGWKVSAEIVPESENEARLNIRVKARGEELSSKMVDVYKQAAMDYFNVTSNCVENSIRVDWISSGLQIDE